MATAYGVATISFAFSITLVSLLAGMDEPMSLAEYLPNVRELGWIAVTFCATFTWFWAGSLLLMRYSRNPRTVVAVFLAPTCLFVPILVWAVCYYIAQTKDCVMAAPGWTRFVLFDIFGNGWWWPVFGLYLVFTARKWIATSQKPPSRLAD
jgi:hypothetical protein